MISTVSMQRFDCPMEKLYDLLEGGNFREALRFYRNRLKKEKKIEDLANIAACLYKLGKLDSADRLAIMAIRSGASNLENAYLVRANICLDQGNYRSAYKFYKSLLRSPLSIHALNGFAMIWERKNRQKQSMQILKQLILSHERDYRSHLYMGQYLIRIKAYKLAWPYIQESIRLRPECIDSLICAYQCSFELKDNKTSRGIAKKLISLAPLEPTYYEYLGKACHNLGLPDESAKAYQSAYELCRQNIAYYLNAKNPCLSILPYGSSIYKISKNLAASADFISSSLINGYQWKACGVNSLIPFAFHAAYGPLNLKKVYEPFYSALSQAFRPTLENSLSQSDLLLTRWKESQRIDQDFIFQNESNKIKKIRIGFISHHFYAHSNTQAFKGIIKHLDRSRFEVILIHNQSTIVDSIHLELNSLVDEVVYLSDSLAYSHMLILSLGLDIAFFTDLGMDPFDFILPEMRCCNIQITGWGLPHTSGLKSIDYYLSSLLLEPPANQVEYTEKLILLNGLPCCFLKEDLYYRNLGRGYFMLPDEQLIIGCVQMLHKVHPDMDLMLEKIINKLPDACFVFVSSRRPGFDEAFMKRLAKRAPKAFARTVMLERCDTKDFLALCDCMDIILDTPYYGAGVTAYMSTYVGTPTVTFSGLRLRDSTMAGIYRYLAIKNAPIVNSIPEYIDMVCELAMDFELRLQIKKDTVEAAQLLYDQLDYIRDFEKFCETLVLDAFKS